MRIAALVHYYVPHYMAGSETMLHAMLRALAAAGHDVDVVVTEHQRGPVDYVHDGIRVRRAARGRGVPAALDAFAPDVLISHHQEAPNASHYAWQRAVRREPAPQVVHIVHNTFPGPLAVTRRWRPRLVVFNAWWVREHHAARGGIPSTCQMIVIHPPVRAEDHATTPGTDATLVNLNRDKGGEILYQLARRLPDTQFAGVVGGHGPQIIRRAPNVEIIPHTSDMRRDVWARTRVLLMPSIYESYGMAGVEAMASGIPVIAHPTPGLQESLGDAGIFVDRGDLDGWERELRRLADADEWQAASTAAAKRSAELDPREELAAWVAAVESLS
ncbi:glycosyltransferase family 4 protein [Streptomyces sp. 4N509B]|uniref:glycosyltransferase family 4 protein n=1 Tax=Streptomyces sp. 4N509B TaxID=3457413 RepID=UPI003FD342F5